MKPYPLVNISPPDHVDLPARQIGVQAIDEGAIVKLGWQRLKQIAVLQHSPTQQRRRFALW